MLTPIIVIALVGVGITLLFMFAPMPDKYKQVIVGVAGLLLFIYLRQSGLLAKASIPPMIIDVVMMIVATGFFVWLAVMLIPHPPKWDVAIYIIAGVLLVLCLLSYFGVWNGLGAHVAHHR